MYAVIIFPLLNLTLAVFRSPEFGFFGLVMPTFRHTPLSSGLSTSAGERGLRAAWPRRAPRITWLYVARRGREVVKSRQLTTDVEGIAVGKRIRGGRRRRRGSCKNIFGERWMRSEGRGSRKEVLSMPPKPA